MKIDSSKTDEQMYFFNKLEENGENQLSTGGRDEDGPRRTSNLKISNVKSNSKGDGDSKKRFESVERVETILGKSHKKRRKDGELEGDAKREEDKVIKSNAFYHLQLIFLPKLR